MSLFIGKERREEEDGDNMDMISSFIVVTEDVVSQSQADTIFSSGNKVMSDRFLRDSVVNMLTAGRDTASVAFAWYFWLVSTHPKVENKLREEMKEAFQLKDGYKWPYPSYQGMSKLVYLHGASCEMFRLYPPVPFNRMTSISEDKLPSGHKVGKEEEVIMSVYTLGRMERVWERIVWSLSRRGGIRRKGVCCM